MPIATRPISKQEGFLAVLPEIDSQDLTLEQQRHVVASNLDRGFLSNMIARLSIARGICPVVGKGDGDGSSRKVWQPMKKILVPEQLFETNL